MKSYYWIVIAYYLLFFSISLVSDLSASNNVSKTITWSGEKNLDSSIYIPNGVRLIILPGTTVNVSFIDQDSDKNGELDILVEGSIEVRGTIKSPVTFKPDIKTTNKSYWKGISIVSKNKNNLTKNMYVLNASIALDINGYIKIHSLMITDSEIGLKLKNITYESELNDVSIFHSDSIGIKIDSSNLMTSWLKISKGSGYGLISENSLVEIRNSSIIDNQNSGILNYSNLTVINSKINKNRHGLESYSGVLNIEKSTLSNNNSNGILLGGGEEVEIKHSTIKANGGYGIEMTDWIKTQKGYSHELSKINLIVNRNNIFKNKESNTLDKYIHSGIWDDWISEEYKGEGWMKTWKVSKKLKIPFGRLAWIKFNYNSNTTTNNFLWQPCAGENVGSYNISIKDSRENELIYLDASYLCPSNPLAGQNSNFWNDYENYTGLIDSSRTHDNWKIKKEDILSSDTYLISQYINNGFISNDSNEIIVKPHMENFSFKFYFGGYELSSYSNSKNLNFSNNYFGEMTKDSLIVNPFSLGKIDIINSRTKMIQSSVPLISSENKIDVQKTKKYNEYEELKYLNIDWSSEGWIPFVDIFISADNKMSWERITNNQSNINSYRWWNNLIPGEKFYIKIQDSKNKNTYAVRGPISVIDNYTPLLSVSQEEIDFNLNLLFKNIILSNKSGGSLEWYISEIPSWLKPEKAKGSFKDFFNLKVTLEKGLMNSGKHKSKIIIKSNGGDVVVPVYARIPHPKLIINERILDFDSTKSIMSFTMENIGGGLIRYEIKSNREWIKVDYSSGTFRQKRQIAITIDRSERDKKSHNGLIQIYSKYGRHAIQIESDKINDRLETNPNQPSLVNDNKWNWMDFDYIQE